MPQWKIVLCCCSCAVQDTHIATVLLVAPAGRIAAGSVSGETSAAPPEILMAAFGLPNASGTQLRPGSVAGEKAPTPSALLPER